MKKEDLSKIDGLTEEQISAIVAASSEELKGYIPKSRFDEVNEVKKDLEGQLKDRDNQLKELGEKAKGNEELENTIKGLQDTNKQTIEGYEEKIRNMTLDSAIKSKFADAKHPELFIPSIDRSKVVINQDGTITGLDEQVKTIKETYKDQFVPSVKGAEPNTNGISQPSVGRRAELEKIIADPKTPFVNRIAARDEITNLKEE